MFPRYGSNVLRPGGYFCLKQGLARSIVGDVLNDFFHWAIEDLAQGIQGIHGDIFAPANSVKLTGAEAIFLQQFVLRNSLPAHGLPELVIDDHRIHSFCELA